PVFIIIAVVIKLDSAGPVFFIQKRMMNKDKEFKMIKFRSMVQDADKKQIDFEKLNLTDGPMFKIINDPRFTRVGRLISALSLDELPQLINVLLGQISIVGPRPLSDNELRYNPYWREVRLMVKQGVTGMWQAEGRKMEFESWIRNDLFYVKNQSLSLDFKIIFNTARMLSTCIARQVKLRSKAVPIDVQAQKIKARPQFGSLKGSKSIYGKDC
ncbi:MAG: sugar transferase, partial [Candidatus Omnitrophica bacterium]|nr:sugar transferase [Candidatus Omnitrophota bacterium]